MNSALCLGGPMHGQTYCSTINYFSVVAPREQMNAIYGASHFTEADVFTYKEGSYWLDEIELSQAQEKVKIWKWCGWSS